MRGVFSRAHPSFDRLLVIESGPREITERILPYFYDDQKCRQLDVLTCYTAGPANFDPGRGTLFFANSADIAHDRQRFIRTLIGTPYSVVAIICADSAVLSKWKWTVALFTKAKLLIINENAHFFFLDLSHHRVAEAMLARRMGIRNPTKFIVLCGELLIVPFTVAYLLLYAGAVHVRRLLRAKAAL